MIHKYYGHFTSKQIETITKYLRRQIFYLLLYVDPETKTSYPNTNIDEAIKNVQMKLSGLNSLLCNHTSIINVMSLIESANIELHKSNYDFSRYRKLILDAGAEILKVDTIAVPFSVIRKYCKTIDQQIPTSKKEV